MAYEPNYVVVDGVLKDHVEDLAVIFDTASPAPEGQQTFIEFISERIDEDKAKQEEIFAAIAEKSTTLISVPEKDFEPAYNLVFHILGFSSNFTEILPILLKNLSKSPAYPNGPTLVLAVLTNLFNIIPSSSPLRYDVFLSIIDAADASDNISVILPQLKNLPAWLKEWGVEDKNIQEIYLKISNIISKQEPSIAYKYLYTAASSSPSPDSILVQKLILSALQVSYDFDEVLTLESVQALSKENSTLYKLLEIVSLGDYAAFKKFASSESSFFSSNDIDVENLTRRVRILALTKITSQASQKSIPYSVIADGIDVPLEDVEIWIIDTIRAGLIEGRLSQLKQSLSVHRVTPVGQFGPEEWQLISQKLTSWKSSLKDILDVLRSARENAQKEEEKLAKAKAQQQQHQQVAQAQSA